MAKKKDARKQNTKPRQKKFVYKRATFAVEPESRTLEQMLNDGWALAADQSGKRKQVVEPESKACFVTHYRTQVHGMTFFEILYFTPGMTALAAKIDFEKPDIDIVEHDLATPTGLKLELIQNITYVGVCGNNVILLPQGDLRPPEIEAHFNWLLRQATSVLKDGQEVRLSNRIPPSKEDEVKSAKSIQFSTDIGISSGEGASGAKTLRPHGLSWTAIRSLLAGLGKQMADATDDLTLSGLTEVTPVDVDITLKWPNAGKNKRNELMDRIATGLRHLDTELDFKIKTKNGWIKKKDILLEKLKTVHCKGERPVRDLLWETIHGWLVDLHNDGEIAL